MLKTLIERLTNKDEESLIILDDISPHLLSSWRVAEFNYYLKTFPDSVIYSSASSFRLIDEKRSFEEVREEYENTYPNFTGRVKKFNPNKKLNSQLVYMIFLNNAESYLSTIEKNRLPFIFCLYPGGGFQLNNEESDNKLKKVFSSPFFKKVICTQKITHEYIVKNNLCEASKIQYIFGAVLPTDRFKKISKKYFKAEKSTFDICFVANKYMDKGLDKGYDIFVSVAERLTNEYDDIFFHVVGNFNEADIDVTALKNKIRFYGNLMTDEFAEFYSDKDIILSPNKPFVLTKGSFDGFPTGACKEAGFNGVALFVADQLNANQFKDREELVIIPNNFESIVELIENYYVNPKKLYDLSEKGKNVLLKTFNIDAQMKPRIELLSKYMNS